MRFRRGILGSLGVFAAILIGGCAIPRGAAVFSERPLDTCGLIDVSANHAGRYIRITDDADQLMNHGGQPQHRHSSAHTHDGQSTETSGRFRPFGTTDTSSSAIHNHRIESSTQSPTQTDEVDNQVSHIGLGLFVREGLGNCIPEGTIIGFVGDELPAGWRELVGVEGMYVRIAPEGERGSLQVFPTDHDHRTMHDHQIVVHQSDPDNLANNQTFNSSQSGQEHVPVTHAHLTDLVTQVDGTTSEKTQTGLPFAAVALLVANEPLGSLPPGAVIPLTRNAEPTGWVRVDLYSIEKVTGSFLRVGQFGEASISSDVPTSHEHPMNHRTSIRTGPPVGDEPRLAQPGQGPALSASSHTHVTEIDFEGDTGPAMHLPPYTEMHLILKE